MGTTDLPHPGRGRDVGAECDGGQDCAGERDDGVERDERMPYV